MPVPFHLAFGVRDLAATREFYGEVLGCAMGRSAPTWQDFDFFGHQLSAHLAQAPTAGAGAVDGRAVPIPHFGAVLDLAAWNALADRLRGLGTAFLIEPELRFAGEPGEQGTFFVSDPSGNTLEFKGFRSMDGVFATGPDAEGVARQDRLKRLRLRCWRRGTREMDLILGPYADGPAAELAPDALEAIERLLDEEDQDLYRWVSGQAPVPSHLEPAIGRIRSHHGIG
jgi:extradiol dioxygenase family protein/succinate dehydrogenase flavin-adding protein (antitoxin of CptAB toxin-antitoxin module)